MSRHDEDNDKATTRRRQRRTKSAVSMAIMGFVGTAALVCGLATAASATLPAGTTVTGEAEIRHRHDLQGRHRLDTDHGHLHQLHRPSGKVPAPPSDTVTLSAPPTISGCTDSSGGTDTITTTGTWKLSETSTTTEAEDPAGRGHVQVERPLRLHDHGRPDGSGQGEGHVQRQEHRHGDERPDPDEWFRVHQHHGHHDRNDRREAGPRRTSVLGRSTTRLAARSVHRVAAHALVTG